jgi:uncharacterized protein YcfL
MRKFSLLLVLAVLVISGCKSIPEPSTASLPVVMDASQEVKTALFQESALRLFRRYGAAVQSDTVVTANYGKYPVRIEYREDKIFITSSAPDKHAGWLSSIINGMRTSR